jgi:hypothetical protein
MDCCYPVFGTKVDLSWKGRPEMYAIGTNSCCSIIELGSLTGVYKRSHIIDAILECIDNPWGKWELSDLDEIPQVYIAATTPVQISAANLLKEMGFTQKKIQGRHRTTFGKNNKYLTFWMRTRQFPEITKWIKERKRDVLRND